MVSLPAMVQVLGLTKEDKGMATGVDMGPHLDMEMETLETIGRQRNGNRGGYGSSSRYGNGNTGNDWQTGGNGNGGGHGSSSGYQNKWRGNGNNGRTARYNGNGGQNINSGYQTRGHGNGGGGWSSNAGNWRNGGWGK